MAEKENDFSIFGDSLLSNKMFTDNEEDNLIDPETLKEQLESLDNNDTDDKSEDVSLEVDSTKSVEKQDVQEITNLEDIEEIEITEDNIPVVVEFFSDKFAEELGWEFGEGEKPKSMEELVSYMENIISSNSKPNYASSEVEELDEFIKRGGNIKDYYSTVLNNDFDVNSIDLSKESNQKLVIKENLRNKGYSELRINKLIDRYEESSILEDEAADAIEEVKETRVKNKAVMLEQVKQHEVEQIKQQKEFVDNVDKTIKSLSDIRGVKIPETDKNKLMEYIFKPTNDGRTQYQKDYNSNLKNLIESAYFTMKGDKLVEQIEKKAASDTTKKITLKLRSTGKSTKNTTSDIDSSGKINKLWDIASSKLGNF